jgi:hypothetical protein
VYNAQRDAAAGKSFYISDGCIQGAGLLNPCAEIGRRAIAYSLGAASMRLLRLHA